MYGTILTARVKAKREGDGIEKVVMSEEADEQLRVDERTISKKTSNDAPVRWGLSGDFTVEVGEKSIVIAEDGSKYAF